MPTLMRWTADYRLLCIVIMVGVLAANVRATGTNPPTVSDFKDLLTLVTREPLNGVSISADGMWTRYPRYPISTSQEIEAYVDREIARMRSEGSLSKTEKEASARKQMREIMTRYAQNIGRGKYTDSYYGDRLRMDRTLYYGTTLSPSASDLRTNADVNTSLIVLDTKALDAVPIIRLSHYARSAFKTRVRTPEESPVLGNILAPDMSIVVFLGSILGKVRNPHPGMTRSALEFDEVKASQLINGSSSSGFNISLQRNAVNDTKSCLYVFSRTISTPANGRNEITNANKQIRLEVEAVTTARCTYVSRTLLDLSPAFFLEDRWEYDADCAPVKFTHHIRNAQGDGFDYEFERISIKQIRPSEVPRLFFDNYPKDYFYEDDSSGKRVAVNVPAGVQIKDIYGVYGGRTAATVHSKTSIVRLSVLGLLALSSIGVFFLALRRRLK